MRRSSRSPNVHWTFDLDGVLVDTRALVQEAYARVGVQMPPDAWGRPAYEWLPNEMGHLTHDWRSVHEAKNAAYERLFRTAELKDTSAVDAARQLNVRHERCYLLTGASARATHAVLNHVLPDLRWVDLYVACTREHKLERLRALCKFGPVVYVDDDAAMCDEVNADPGVWGRVVRYQLDRTTTKDILDGCGDPSGG